MTPRSKTRTKLRGARFLRRQRVAALMKQTVNARRGPSVRFTPLLWQVSDQKTAIDPALTGTGTP